jgi:hypothetical protein
LIIIINNVVVEEKDLVLMYGVAFLEIDLTSGSFFINGSLNQAKPHALLSKEISNFLGEMPFH